MSVNRRAEVLAHSLAEKLPEGDYRHLVITLPKKMGLRKRFQRNTRLHRQIGRLIHRVLTRWTASQIGCHRNRKEEREKARPGIIMAPQGFLHSGPVGPSGAVQSFGARLARFQNTGTNGTPPEL